MGAIGFGPGLSLRRRGGAGAIGPPVFDFTGGALSTGAVVTRGSAGTRVDAAGLVASVGADGARFDHDPVTLAPRGLLIEGAGTNVLAHASDQADSGWARSGAVVSVPGGVAAPDGSPAQMIADNGDMAASSVLATHSFIAESAGEHVFQIFARAGTRGRVRLRYLNLVSVPVVEFNLATLAVTSGSGAIEDSGGGWRRLSAPVTIDASDLNGAVQWAMLSDAGSTVMTRDGTNTLYLWGAQVAAGGGGSFVPTTAAPVARAADMLTLDWGARGVADGALSVLVTFDDLSTQMVGMTVAGGSAVLPGGLARSRVRRLERV